MKWIASRIDEIVCAILLVVLVGSISAAVLFRYVLNSPLPWPEELARFALVWLTFIGASVATKRHSHIVVNYAEPLLPQPARLWIVLAVHFVVVAFLLLFVVMGIQLVLKSWVAVSPALSIRMGYVYLAVPLGSASMIVHMVSQMPATVRALRPREGA